MRSGGISRRLQAAELYAQGRRAHGRDDVSQTDGEGRCGVKISECTIYKERGRGVRERQMTKNRTVDIFLAGKRKNALDMSVFFCQKGTAAIFTEGENCRCREFLGGKWVGRNYFE